MQAQQRVRMKALTFSLESTGTLWHSATQQPLSLNSRSAIGQQLSPLARSTPIPASPNIAELRIGDKLETLQSVGLAWSSSVFRLLAQIADLQS